MNYLLDTCVLSETIKPKPDQGLVDWLTAREESTLFVSALTLGELHKGIERLPSGKKNHALLLWLASLRAAYTARLRAFAPECSMTRGEITARAAASGRAPPGIDSMLAATALRNDCSLVTRNVDAFSGIDVKLINPWGALYYYMSLIRRSKGRHA